MLDIIKSYISKESFYIITMEDRFYIKNYSKIINISTNEVLIEINQFIYKFIGKNFILTKSINRELEIKGVIESISKL